MSKLNDILEALDRIDSNTARTADAAEDLLNVAEEMQKDAIRNDG